MKTVLYCRVSTAEQTIDHQETQARAAGFAIDEVVSDEGVSGVSTALRNRDGGRRLFDILRKGDVLVVRWVDRLGRNYVDVCDAIREFMRRGVVIRTVINNMTFDGATTNPMEQAVRDALIGFMAASAQAQAEATREAMKAGIAHARKKEPTKFLGRKPEFSRDQLDKVISLLSTGSAGPSHIAKEVGLNRQTVHRIRANPGAADAALTAWELAAEQRKEKAA
ncbi:MAG: recombinase family protein [Methylocystis sp.]